MYQSTNNPILNIRCAGVNLGVSEGADMCRCMCGDVGVWYVCVHMSALVCVGICLRRCGCGCDVTRVLVIFCI